jgi:hypothetical protein
MGYLILTKCYPNGLTLRPMSDYISWVVTMGGDRGAVCMHCAASGLCTSGDAPSKVGLNTGCGICSLLTDGLYSTPGWYTGSFVLPQACIYFVVHLLGLKSSTRHSIYRIQRINHGSHVNKVYLYQINNSEPHHSGAQVGAAPPTRSQLTLHRQTELKSKPRTWLPPAHPYPLPDYQPQLTPSQ